MGAQEHGSGEKNTGLIVKPRFEGWVALSLAESQVYNFKK